MLPKRRHRDLANTVFNNFSCWLVAPNSHVFSGFFEYVNNMCTLLLAQVLSVLQLPFVPKRIVPVVARAASRHRMKARQLLRRYTQAVNYLQANLFERATCNHTDIIIL